MASWWNIAQQVRDMADNAEYAWARQALLDMAADYEQVAVTVEQPGSDWSLGTTAIGRDYGVAR